MDFSSVYNLKLHPKVNKVERAQITFSTKIKIFLNSFLDDLFCRINSNQFKAHLCQCIRLLLNAVNYYRFLNPKLWESKYFFLTYIILAKHLFKIYVLILKITKKSSYFVTFIIFLSEYVVQGIFLHRNMTIWVVIFTFISLYTLLFIF